MVNSKVKKKIKKLISLVKIQANYLFDFTKKHHIDYLTLPTLYYSIKPQNTSENKLRSLFKTYLYVFKGDSAGIENNEVFFSKTIPNSSASLYIMDLGTIKSLKKEGIYANYVSIPLTALFLRPLSVLYFIKRGRYLFKSIQFYVWPMLLFKSYKQHSLNRNTRRYIPKEFDRTSFMLQLKKDTINAVALRWFDNFDSMKNNLEEDIDILIDDDAIPKLDLLLKDTVGVLPIDVYSVSGLPGSNYAGIPYYPFTLANQILATKRLHEKGFFIPNKEEYFFSLCYHIVFHKGISSGIPIDQKDQVVVRNPEHNYAKIVSKLLIKNNFDTKNVTLTKLYNILQQEGYCPSYDLLLKLYNKKREDVWYQNLKKVVENEISSNFEYKKGLSVFIIRKRAFDKMIVDNINDFFTDHGFEVLYHSKINPSVISSVMSNIRGGNWGRGPFTISGGAPSYYFIVYDPLPVLPNNKELAQYPNLENKRVISIKKSLRKYFNTDEEIPYNGVHSSDNFFEAIDYMKQLCNYDLILSVLSKVDAIKKYYQSDFLVLKDFSRNKNRAKVELISFEAKNAIQKTFRKGSERFLQNEVFFLESFKNNSFAPNLLKKDKNKIIIEYFEHAKEIGNYKGFISPKVVLKIRKILETIFHKGITILDFNPSNVLLCNEEVKLIDFEFAKYYDQKPNTISNSYELSKIPKDYKYPRPAGTYYDVDAYKSLWENKFYLSKKQFLEINNPIYMFFLMRFNYVYFKLRRWN